MNFGQAIGNLKDGYKLARKGWNGEGMFVYYVPSNKYKSCTPIGNSIADKDGNVEYEPYFAIKNAKGTVSTWVPSINDCLAEDWEILEHERVGKGLIGRKIKQGTKFKVINISPHEGMGYICLNEYVGKIGRFTGGFAFTNRGFHSTGKFEEEYMNAIDRENGGLCWQYDEVEILD